MTEEEKKPAAAEKRVRVFATSPEEYFRAGFEKIARTRMKGIPICNPRLSVSTVPFRKIDGQWVGGVATPWSLLVIRACGDAETWESIPETKVRGIDLPGGAFRFMGICDPELGEYQSCSLLSPTWEIGDQPTAEAVVRISLDTMLSPPKPGVPTEEPEEEGIPLTPAKPAEEPGEAKKEKEAEEPKKPSPLSRRAMFRRAVGAAKEIK